VSASRPGADAAPGREAPLAAGLEGACETCCRHSWLLRELTVPLDYCSRDPARLMDALALEQGDLLAALGGRRREELAERLLGFARERLTPPAGVEALCRHDPRFPPALLAPCAPHLLFLTGAVARLQRLVAAPVVAILGSPRASDYGVEMARAIARGLAAAGVTVASALADPLSAAAQTGVRELAGASIAVSGDGPRAAAPARWRSLQAHVRDAGCLIWELPGDARGRRFGAIAAQLTLAELAAVSVVVEARERPADLAGAMLARARGRPLAAVPGRVTSPLSAGPHALLAGGAALARGAHDVLELLPVGPPQGATACEEPRAALPPRLRALLERVCAGSDTAERLCAGGDGDPAEVLLGLSELELMGLLGRGSAGRYLPRG